MSLRRILVATLTAPLLWTAEPVRAQSSGQIIGIILDQSDSSRVSGARVSYSFQGEAFVTGPVSDAKGEFVLIGLAPGTYTVQVRRIGYQTVQLENIKVRSGSAARISLSMIPAAQTLAPIVVEAEEALLTPDITANRQVVSREQIDKTPIETVEQIIDLQVGVTDGHFRGGRFGQETFIIDGVDVKDQFSASTTGAAFQLAPSAVQEVSVFTSGFSADQGSAVSGVVSLVTRQGPTDHWIGRVEYTTDDWAPDNVKRGYVRTGFSAGGPLPFLTRGSRIFMDLTTFGRGDQDPRVEGITCVKASFNCPLDRATIPHQRGDRYFAFTRLDVPLSDRVEATVTFNRNRDQHELYSTRFKYNLNNYLAERQTGTLLTGQLVARLQPQSSRAMKITTRVALGRVDRYLGVPERSQPAIIGRFMPGDIRFRGEDFVKRPIGEQLASTRTVPGYVQPSDSGTGSPYGIFGRDLFVTDGTSGIAQWSVTDFLDAGAELQTVVSPQHDLKVGADVKFFHIRSYQHVAAGLVGAAPSFAEFYPRTVAAYVHNTLYAKDAATIDLGVRLEAFKPRLEAQRDRQNFSSPIETAEWRVQLAPRIGFGIPLSIVGIDRAALKWNFGLFTQPPDFQFFFDQALDDSLNTAVRRQGNPNLSFERATQFEGGIEYLVSPELVIKANGFVKDLTSLTTSGIAVSNQSELFTNLDFGRVYGGEARVIARLDNGNRIEAGYTLQKAFGVVSTAFDSITGETGEDGTMRVEVPLQFDRRHAIDVSVIWNVDPVGVTASLAGSAGSGIPVPGAADRRLPWNVALSFRLVKEVHLQRNRVSFLFEARNILNRENLVTARLDGSTQPDVREIETRALNDTRNAVPIPRESPLYVPGFDANGDGILDRREQASARRSALLDASEPTLFFGEARQFRLGIQWNF